MALSKRLTYQGDLLVEDTIDEVSMSDGAYSWYFDGNTQSVYVPHNTVLNFAAVDWTIEFWALPTATDNISRALFFKRATAAAFAGVYTEYNGSTGYWTLGVSNAAGTAWTVATTTAITCDVGVWQHIAFVRNGANIYGYKNGVRTTISTAMSTAAIFDDGSAAILGTEAVNPTNGATSYGAYRYRGYLSNFCVTKGVARYTAATVTVPSAPLSNQGTPTSLLTCQSNTFKDNSSYAHAIYDTNTPTISYKNPFINESSVRFNGAQYLTFVPTAGTAASMSTTDFTVEAWINSAAPLARQMIMDAKTGATLSNWAFGFGIGSAASGALTWSATAGTALLSASYSFSPNTWYHVAYIRKNSIGYLYVNGVQQATVADSRNYNQSYDLAYIGTSYNQTAGTYFTGLISNLRLTKAFAVYPGNFTVPTRSFTDDQIYNTTLNQNVSFLLGTRNTFLGSTASIADNSKNLFTITNVGSATLSYDNIPPFVDSLNVNETSVPVAQRLTNSVVFNGTNQSLNGGAIGNFNFLHDATSDYTIEFWVYPNTATSNYDILSTAIGSAQIGIRISLSVITAGDIAWLVYNGSAGSYAGRVTATGTYVANQWQHIAVTFSASSKAIGIYLNGVAKSTSVSGTDPAVRSYVTTNSTNPLYIGSLAGGAGALLNGYLSNIRITKHQVYTGTFTPSTSPLQTTQSAGTNIVAITAPASVSLLTCQNYGSFVDNSFNNYTINTLPTTLSTTARDTLTTSTKNPFNATTQNLTLTNNYYSYLFNGTSQYLTVPTNAVFAFGTGDFTIECWLNKLTTGQQYIIDFRANLTDTAPILYVTASNVLNYYGSITGTTTIAVNTWYHVALVRSSGVTKLYLNGVQEGSSYTDTNSYVNTAPVGIGWGPAVLSSGSWWQGYISNLRIVKGIGLYSSSFTVPTSPLNAVSGTVLLTCQSSVIQDNSATPFTITNVGVVTADKVNPFRSAVTDYSVSLNGSTQYLITPASASYNIGSNDFTIESFVYFNTISSSVYSTIAGIWLSTGSKLSWLIQCINSNIQLAYSTNSSNILIAGFATSLSTGQWYHIAITRTSGNVRCFVNGQQMGTTPSIPTFATPSQPVYIGVNIDGTQQFLNGYISNFRFVNGTGLYTTTFVPPKNSLTAVTNTVLLTATHSQILDYSTLNNTLTNQGTATVSSSVIPTFTTLSYNQAEFPVSKLTPTGTLLTNNYMDDYTLDSYSVLFNGTSQYIYPSGTYNSIAFGVGDFTVEFWIYFNSVSGTQTLIEGRPFGVTSTALRINMALVSGSINYYTANVTAITGFSPAVNTWYHIALVRQSGVTKMYSNGTQVGSSYADQSGYIAGLNRPAFGVDGSVQNASYFSGYLSNFRIVTGLAVYTANFSTVGLYPLSNIKGNGYDTTLLTCQTNTLIDNSPINATMANANSPVNTNITSTFYSTLFNGSSNYLTVPTSSFLTATNTYTIEMWINPSAYPGGTNVASLYNVSNSNVSNFGTMNVQLVGSTGTLRVDLRPSTGGTNVTINTVTTVALNAWTHVAVVVNAGAATIYINGVSSGTGTVVALDGTQTFCSIGYLTNGYTTLQTYYNGRISNLRIIKNIARYTANFVPEQTQQLTAVGGTSLLTCQSSSVTTDNSGNALSITTSTVAPTSITPILTTQRVAKRQYATGVIETVGQIDDVTKLDNSTIGYGSTYFNGHSDYITSRSRTAGAFLHQGTTDWTIEFWVRYSAFPTSSARTIFSTGDGTASYIGLAIQHAFGGTNTDNITISNGTTLLAQTTATSSITAIDIWYHKAWVFSLSASTIRYYINGIAQSISTVATYAGPSGYAYSSSTTSSQAMIIGRRQYVSIAALNHFYGYLSNFRITKQQVYTGAFTPSISPLARTQSSGTNIAAITDPYAVTLLTCQNFDNRDNSIYNTPLIGSAKYSSKYSPF